MVAPNGIPIGPGLHAKFLLGADDNGRDVMVRLMYGGRTSIYIGVMAAVDHHASSPSRLGWPPATGAAGPTRSSPGRWT